MTKLMITDDQIKTWGELVAAATTGPWEPCGANGGRCICGLVWANPHVPLQGEDMEPSPTADDAAFICAARVAVPALVTEVERLRDENTKLRAGECLGMIPPTDIACQRDCYCSVACQTRDADGSRGDLSRTLVPQALIDDRDSLRDRLRVSEQQNEALGDANVLAVENDRLRAALREACDLADAALMPNDRVSREWYEQHALNRDFVRRIYALREIARGSR